MLVCLCVLSRNPNRCTDWDEIWHGGGPPGQEGSWESFDLVPCTPGYRVHIGGMGCHNLLGVGHLFGPPSTDLEGPGPSVLLEPQCLTSNESLLNENCSAGSK